nr:hypothetical protein BaRGS_009810 [Batillaria attramentaria]
MLCALCKQLVLPGTGNMARGGVTFPAPRHKDAAYKILGMLAAVALVLTHVIATAVISYTKDLQLLK